MSSIKPTGVPGMPADFYCRPVTDGSLLVSDLESLATSRVKMLMQVAAAYGSSFSTDLKDASMIQINAAIRKSGIENIENRSPQEADEISHFFLRLAFAGDKDKCSWFIRQECRLFNYRLTKDLEKGDIEAINKQCDSESLKLNYYKNLMALSKNVTGNPMPFEVLENILQSSPDIEFLTRAQELMPKEEGEKSSIHSLVKIRAIPHAASLLRGRKVIVDAGYAYVPIPMLRHILISRFKNHLTQHMNFLCRTDSSARLEPIKTDSRVKEILKGLPNVHLKTQKVNMDIEEGWRLQPQNFDQMRQIAFPPCMHRLDTALRKNRHLTHWGRLQLQLFLKGCGMTVDEQLAYWRQHWSDPEKFDKEHRYNIRHNYGLEGKKANYPPFPCRRIMMTLPPPGVSERHGCPFSHCEQPDLERLLKELNCDGPSVQRCVMLSKERHHGVACLEFFKARFPTSDGSDVGNHPNSFYLEGAKTIATTAPTVQAEGEKN